MEYRMYCLVLRQLNGINKGIQAAHACLEYANGFHNEADYQKYVNDDKTLILLDGGTYQDLVDKVNEQSTKTNLLYEELNKNNSNLDQTNSDLIKLKTYFGIK